MATSSLLQRHIEEHNNQVRAANGRLADAKATLKDIEAAFDEHERSTRAFHRQITDRVKVLIATAERDVADLGHAIDTLETPGAALLDMSGVMRSAAE